MKDNIVLVRVDDRLIHSNIVSSWLNAYPYVNNIMCIDDFTSKDPFMQKMFQMFIPKDKTVETKSTKEAIETLKKGLNKPIMIVVKNLLTIKNLVEFGIPITKINIGSLGMSGKRKMFYQNVAIDDEEKIILSELVKKGIKIEIQNIPSDPIYDCTNIFKKDS